MLQMMLHNQSKYQMEFNGQQIYLAISFYNMYIYNFVYHTDVFSDNNNEDEAVNSNLDKTLDISISPLTKLDKLGLYF